MATKKCCIYAAFGVSQAPNRKQGKEGEAGQDRGEPGFANRSPEKRGMRMIRKFERADTEQVMGIWLEANLEAHAFIPGEYWRSQYEAVEEQLSQAEIYVYEREQNIQGFAGMVGDYLAGIFVDGKSRCAGIGRSLLTCIKRNYPAFSLHVYQKNRRAVDFYLREGLSVVSEGVDEDTKEADYTMEWKE